MGEDKKRKLSERKKARKFDYFDAFARQAEIAWEEAKLVTAALESFDKDGLPDLLDKAHAIENDGDDMLYSILKAADKEFITPIERADLVTLAFYLDDVTDSFEKILRNFYMYGVDKVTKSAAKMCSLLSDECHLMYKSAGNFREFKKPDKLRERAREIESIEEEVDALYLDAMHSLFAEDDGDTRKLVQWRALYATLEDCSDAIEKVTDLMTRIVISSS